MAEFVEPRDIIHGHQWDGNIADVRKFLSDHGQKLSLGILDSDDEPYGDLVVIDTETGMVLFYVSPKCWVIFISSSAKVCTWNDYYVTETLLPHYSTSQAAPTCTQEHYPYSPWENERDLNV